MISERKARILVVTNFVLIGLVVVLVAQIAITQATSASDKTDFKEINAERINIKNANGKTVIAIANKEKIARPRVEGKEYPVEVSEGRKYMAGMIFFNEDGDEMGGLVFNSFRQKNGRIAGIGHLSLDRFRDNQVISLQHNENRRGVKTGLTFYDRPGNGNFKKSLDLLEEARSKSTTPKRLDEIKKTFGEWSKTKALGRERVFIGSKNEIPQLVLKDDMGKTRFKVYVDEKNEARLQFLNDSGKVISEFPAK